MECGFPGGIIAGVVVCARETARGNREVVALLLERGANADAVEQF